MMGVHKFPCRTLCTGKDSQGLLHIPKVHECSWQTTMTWLVNIHFLLLLVVCTWGYSSCCRGEDMTIQLQFLYHLKFCQSRIIQFWFSFGLLWLTSLKISHAFSMFHPPRLQDLPYIPFTGPCRIRTQHADCKPSVMCLPVLHTGSGSVLQTVPSCCYWYPKYMLLCVEFPGLMAPCVLPSLPSDFTEVDSLVA